MTEVACRKYSCLDHPLFSKFVQTGVDNLICLSSHYSPVSSEEARFRREAVAKVIAENSRKPSADD